MADPVIIKPGTNSVVVTGGVAVAAIPPNINGGFITNPQQSADQGVTPAEALYINPIAAGGLVANGTNFALPPGSTWTIVPGQTTATWVNAATAGHRFSVVYW